MNARVIANPTELLSLSVGESAVSEFIPYTYHLTDTIIGTTNTEYITVWKIDGRSHLNATYADAVAWVDEINNLLSGFISPHVAFWTHQIRRRVDEYPAGSFENPFCQRLNQKYRDSFAGVKMMANDIYLTVVYRPVIDKTSSFFGAFAREKSAEKKKRQQRCIKTLTDINRSIAAGLGRRYGAENLGLYEHNGHMFSEAAEFLHYLVNFEHRRIPLTRKCLKDCLPSNRPMFDPTSYMGEMVSPTGRKYFGMVDIFDYSAYTEPGQFNGLLEAEYEYILTQSFTAHSKRASIAKLEKQQQDLIDAGDAAEGQIKDLSTAMELIQSGEVFGGDHHATLNIIANSIDDVNHAVADAVARFADVATIVKVVDSASEAAFWAQLPGNYGYRPRPSFITSKNFLSFNSFHNYMKGKATGNPWGDAVTVFKTKSSSPLYFNFHYSADGVDVEDKFMLGNTCITGMAGAGKTALLGFLVAQAQKFGVTAVAIDKDRGMEVAIRLMGGRYLPIKTGVPTGLNPFQLEPTPANLAFLKRFVKTLISEYGAITHADELEIGQAVDSVMALPKEARRITVLLQVLPNPAPKSTNDRPTVHARLEKWAEGGNLGWVFDNQDDLVNLATHTLYGFDVTEFLDNPETRSPLMMYLLYRTEAMLDGRRFMYIFDEFWKPLQDPYFEDLVKNKQKTIRKQNGLSCFSTQEPEDLSNSPIASTLISQMATMIFLPNPRADKRVYMDVLKLTETEYAMLRSLGETSRTFMIKQNGSVALATLDLHGFDDELLVLSGTPEFAEIAEQLANEFGEDPELWYAEYLRQARATQRNKNTKGKQ